MDWQWTYEINRSIYRFLLNSRLFSWYFLFFHILIKSTLPQYYQYHVPSDWSFDDRLLGKIIWPVQYSEHAHWCSTKAYKSRLSVIKKRNEEKKNFCQEISRRILFFHYSDFYLLLRVANILKGISLTPFDTISMMNTLWNLYTD